MKKIQFTFFLLLAISLAGCAKDALKDVTKTPTPVSVVNCDNWTATDALGRKLPNYYDVGGLRKGKYVGLFYSPWHTNFANGVPNNTPELLAKDPSAIDNYNSPIWPNNGSPFFWSEPLFGYYRDTDDWVLRRHAEMLAAAGVDVIVFDCTNGSYTWKESYMELCKVFSEARAEGIKTPQIAFMLAFGPTDGSLTAIEDLYNALYQPGLYKDLWFCWKGKPFIMAYPDNIADVPGDAVKTKMHQDIRNFFTFRTGQPAYNVGPVRDDQWGWLEIYPQHGFVNSGNGSYEEVTVGVAQNWSKERGLTAMNAPDAFGRSYTNARGQINSTNAELYGYNFQEQWDRAISMDPELIFVTGWNEWIAGRFDKWQSQTNAFPDEFSPERSRDIEPMKGGHGDNYYYQMAFNIRKFKGASREPEASTAKTVTIDGKFDEWNDVSPEFTAFKGSTMHRNSAGWQGYSYVNNTGRNDIVSTKVARDDQNLCFYVKTAEDLTSPQDKNWMRLFIDTDRDKTTGWEGYDYVLNRVSPDGTKSILEKNTQGWSWEKVGEVDYAVSGNEMEIKIPRQLLNMEKGIDFEFKWSDNMQEEGDVMDFYLNGDAAPLGRFNYHYFTK